MSCRPLSCMNPSPSLHGGTYAWDSCRLCYMSFLQLCCFVICLYFFFFCNAVTLLCQFYFFLFFFLISCVSGILPCAIWWLLLQLIWETVAHVPLLVGWLLITISSWDHSKFKMLSYPPFLTPMKVEMSVSIHEITAHCVPCSLLTQQLHTEKHKLINQ